MKWYELQDWHTRKQIPGTACYKTPEDAVAAADKLGIKRALLARIDV